jgi:hypothetical protein
MSQARYQKRLRERARLEKAEAKRQRREARQASAASSGKQQPVDSQPEVLAQLAALHLSFAEHAIDFDEFERRKHELTARLDA